MPTADELVKIAMQHVGEKYDWGADVPLDRRNYTGPWDCAEFVSWAVYQTLGQVMGCINNEAPLKELEPYSGSWARDAEALGIEITVEQAAKTRGAILVRKPRKEIPGHVSISRGDGTTIEAMDTAHGVAVGKIAGRRWDACCRISDLDYAVS